MINPHKGFIDFFVFFKTKKQKKELYILKKKSREEKHLFSNLFPCSCLNYSLHDIQSGKCFLRIF